MTFFKNFSVTSLVLPQQQFAPVVLKTTKQNKIPYPRIPEYMYFVLMIQQYYHISDNLLSDKWKLQYLTVYHIQVPEGVSAQSIPRDEDPVASCVPHCYTQDVSLACSLPSGAYTILPSTYEPNCSASFTLSLARRIHRLALFPC